MKKPKEAHFQNYAFDKELDRSFEAVDCRITRPKRGIFNELAHLMDFSGHVPGDKGSIGFHIGRFRTGYERKAPHWTKSKEETQKVLLRAFPKLKTCDRQRKRAAIWAQVITLHYLTGWSEKEIADEMNQSVCRIRHHIAHIENVAKGHTANGRPRRRNSG